jgi:glycerol-3-phosphate acyltransferase PlsX
VGEEEQKGNDAVQEAAKILKCAPNTLNFYGFIEGDDIGKGTVDVVVTDGFTGNVALKALEGMAFFIMTFMKEVFKASWLARVGYLLSMFAMKKFKNKLNAKNYNGAMLIGLGGVAIKSHGSADSIAFANAIHVAASMVSHDLNKKIEKSLKQLYKDIKKHAPKADVA